MFYNNLTVWRETSPPFKTQPMLSKQKSETIRLQGTEMLRFDIPETGGK
jgi:hypothetical protein